MNKIFSMIGMATKAGKTVSGDLPLSFRDSVPGVTLIISASSALVILRLAISASKFGNN